MKKKMLINKFREKMKSQQRQNKELPEYIKKKNYYMTCVICLAIALQGIILASISFIDSNTKVVISTIAYTLVMIITLLYTLFKKSLTFFYYSASLMVICLALWFLYSGGTEGFGIIWLAVIPLFTLYLIPYTGFIILNTTVLALMIVAFWTPLHDTNLVYDFSNTFRIRFPLLYLFEFLFSIYLKYRIHHTELALVEQKNILSTEIKQASIIQKTFFKRKTNNFDGWEIASSCKPMAGVSGDLYDFYLEKTEEENEGQKPEKLLGLGIYDISGHGISSGIITLLAKNIFSQEFNENLKLKLETVMKKMNERFIVEKGDLENYITGILVRMKDSDSKGNANLELVNAGHQPPVIYRHETEKLEYFSNSLEARGGIGINAIKPNYVSLPLTLEKDDELILYTDGIIDCCAPDGKTLGRDGLLEIIKNNLNKPVESQLNDIFAQIKTFMGNKPAKDDMTIIIMRYTGC